MVTTTPKDNLMMIMKDTLNYCVCGDYEDIFNRLSWSRHLYKAKKFRVIAGSNSRITQRDCKRRTFWGANVNQLPYMFLTIIYFHFTICHSVIRWKLEDWAER